MSRTIELKDGKTLRKFHVSRMGAYQAESWLIRAALVCGRDPGDLGKIFTGDKVSLELSPYDLTKGRITFRHIEGRPSPAPAAGNQSRRR